MEPHILLAQLRSLLERAPDFNQYKITSREHSIWLAQAYALVSRWNSFEAITIKVSSENLVYLMNRDSHVSKILGVVYRAIADLEIGVPNSEQVSFGEGEVYDFFKTLNRVIASAEKSIFIIDPYLDTSVFDHYLVSRQEGVTVRFLSSKRAEDLVPFADKYNQQYGDIIELRKSNKIHDRVIFVDNYVCWLIGQSLKDAAKAKPTYVVQAPPDIVPIKLNTYDDIWSNSQTLAGNE